jgi:hypothetical protein
VIVGSSDSGKTAIIRAIRKVVRNRPTGDAFRSNWGGDTSISIDTDYPEARVTWAKKGNEASYTLSEWAQETIEFKAMGTEVPEEVSNVLNINEINLQEQLDSPFLLTASPGEVAQHFNKIAHLDQIDQGIKIILQWMRGIKTTITFQEGEKEAKEVRLEDYTDLDKMEAEVEVLEDMEKQSIQLWREAASLSKHIDKIQEVNAEIEEESILTAAQPEVDRLLAIYQQFLELRGNILDLEALIEEIESIEEAITKGKKLVEADKEIDTLLDLYLARDNERVYIDRLEVLIGSIHNVNTKLKQAEAWHKKVEKQFHDEFPEMCPLCGKPK